MKSSQRCCRPAILVFLLISVTASAALAQEDPNQLANLNELTRSLIVLSDRPPNEQSSAGDLARQRRDLLLSIAATSPRAVSQFFLPPGIAKKLPPSAQAFLETDADETGTLTTVVEDYARSHKLRFFLDTGGENVEMYFSADAPRLLSGSRIRARGKRLANVLLMEAAPIAPLVPAAGAPSPDLQVLALATPNTFGEQSTAVLLVNFSDDTSQPLSFADARNLVFNEVSNFDRENSQNQTWLRGDVFGWFTVPISITTCPGQISLETAALKAAADAGVDLSGYNRLVYVFPRTACAWLGLATIGGTPSHALINGAFTLEVVGHEMGHNLGVYHSHSLDCPGTTMGNNCQRDEYGDLFDIMGQYTASHFNAFQKERLGWLNYGSSLPITTVTSSGVYSLAPYETGSGVKALKVSQSIDSSTGLHTWYYLEYRQLLGFDSGLSVYPRSVTGVLVRTGADGNADSSFLLNMNPQDSSFADAELRPGETFSDPVSGVTITTQSADANGATVDIEIGSGGGCQQSAPKVTVTPSQSPPSSAGSTQSFLVSVTSQDTAACGNSTFLIGAAVPTSPAGWTATINPSAFALAPQSSVTATMQVASPATTPAGSYPTTVTATKWPNLSYSASTTATVVIDSAAGADFTLSAPASASVQQASSASISVTSSVSNGFSAPVSLSISGLPTGVTAAFSPSSFAAPGSGTSTLTFTAAASATPGSYTVSIAGSGGGLTHMSSVRLSVTNSPPPPPPPPQDSFTLFAGSATPAVLNAGAGAPLELGMKFTSDRDGQITGVRFYKGSSNLGAHAGSLWSSSGQLLAQQTFTSETPSGWQQAAFSAPVPITANTVYVISYHSNGGYSYTSGYFNSAVDNPPLHAVRNTGGNNGVYSYGANSLFPASGAAGANFWVDVVFTTTASTASLATIAVTPANPSISAGLTQQFHAVGTYSDNTTRDITARVNWSSATAAIATIDAAGLATAKAAGSSLITASLGSISGATTLTVTSAPPPPPPPADTYTLFSSTAVPVVANANAGSPLELGMQFTADRSGYATGVRFYKGSSNVGAHVGSLWSRTGVLLAQTAFSSETSSGWQQAIFSAPVAITANTIYVISYHCSGVYSYTSGFFNSPVDNPPLHAVPNTGGNNGVYSYGANSTFPASSAAGANFWVDVVFTTGAGTASLVSIAITPAGPSISAGSTQQFHAIGTYSDNTTQDITGQVGWSSGTPGVATINAAGLATGVSAGASLITATAGAISGTTTLTVTSAPPPPPGNTYSLFSSTAVPAVLNANASSPLEMGMLFTADRKGQISGIRFYKGSSNGGTHVGSLWTSTGQLLAQATFTGETSSGWQQVNFAAPVAIAANTVYVVSYHSSGGYSYNAAYFNTMVDNPPLHAVPNTAGNNGVYSYGAGSTFPTIGAAGANFWVDVVFQ